MLSVILNCINKYTLCILTKGALSQANYKFWLNTAWFKSGTAKSAACCELLFSVAPSERKNRNPFSVPLQWLRFHKNMQQVC